MIPIVQDGTRFPCKFLLSATGPAIISLNAMKQLKFQLIFYLLLAVLSELNILVQKCTRVTGGMKIPKVKLEVAGDPLFLKRRIIAFGLRDSVERTLNQLVERNILSRVSCSQWAPPIVKPIKSDGWTPMICGDRPKLLLCSNSFVFRECTYTMREPSTNLPSLVKVTHPFTSPYSWSWLAEYRLLSTNPIFLDLIPTGTLHARLPAISIKCLISSDFVDIIP